MSQISICIISGSKDQSKENTAYLNNKKTYNLQPFEIYSIPFAWSPTAIAKLSTSKFELRANCLQTPSLTKHDSKLIFLSRVHLLKSSSKLSGNAVAILKSKNINFATKSLLQALTPYSMGGCNI